MPYIDQIQISSTTYDIRDNTARQHNIPLGGSTGQILKKDSNSDYEVSWQNDYTLPNATSTTLGGIKIGNGFSTEIDGTLSVDLNKLGIGNTIVFDEQNNTAIIVSQTTGTSTTQDLFDILTNGLSTKANIIDLENYLPLSGGTIIGDLVVSKSGTDNPTVRVKRTNITLGTAPASDTWMGEFDTRDSNNTIMSAFAGRYLTDKTVCTRVLARNGGHDNYVEMKTGNDGTPSVDFSDPDAWCEGMGAVKKSGDTMTGTLKLHTTNGLEFPAASGYTTDQYGRFIHKRSNVNDYWALMNNAGTDDNFIVKWESGEVTAKGTLTIEKTDSSSLCLKTTNGPYTSYITAYPDSNNSTNGNNMVIKAGGNMIIGGGEFPSSAYSNNIDSCTTSTENLYLGADSAVRIYSNANTIANRYTWTFTNGGKTQLPSALELTYGGTGATSASGARTNLQLVPTLSKSEPSAISVANNTLTEIASISLGVGYWIVGLSAEFASNSTGYRYIQSGGVSGYYGRESCPAVNGRATDLHIVWPCHLDATTTVTLSARHTAGAALNVTPRIYAIRIANF